MSAKGAGGRVAVVIPARFGATRLPDGSCADDGRMTALTSNGNILEL